MNNKIDNLIAIFTTIVFVPATFGFDSRCFHQVYDKNVIILQHPENCRKYYKCDHNFKLVEKDCPPMLEFNPLLKICDWPQGFCTPNSHKPTNSVMIDMVPKKINKIISKSPENDDINTPSKQPNYANECRSYFVCENVKCQEEFCHDGTIFDSITSACMENAYCDRNHSPAQIQGRATPSYIDCSVKQTTWYPDQDDCTKFYICAYGTAYRQQCHSGQYFNRIDGVCTQGSTNTCLPSGNPTPMNRNCCRFTNGQLIPDPFYTNKYYICTDGTLEAKYCPSGFSFDERILQCKSCKTTTAEKLSFCGPLPPYGVLPDLFNKNSYYMCMNGKLIQQPCPSTLVFDSISLSCKPASDVSPTTSTATEKACGPIKHGTLFADMADHSKFYVCLNGEVVHQSCPTGELYDETAQLCKLTGATTETIKPCGLTPDGGFAAHKTDSKKFYMCTHGDLVEMSCPEGQTFHATNLYCRSLIPTPTPAISTIPCGSTPDGGFAAHQTDNKKFYVCTHGDLVEMSCPEGHTFDALNLYCRSLLPTTTPAISIPCGSTPDGGFAAHETNNKKFYICTRGVLVERSCPEGHTFDALNLYCRSLLPTPTPAISIPCGSTPDGGFAAHKTDSKKFYMCTHGDLVEMSCPEGHTFDALNLYCRSVLPTPTPAISIPCGSTPDGGFAAHKTDNKKFYICTRGVLVERSCPEGHTFDATNLYCRSLLPTTDTTAISTIACGSTPDGGFVAHKFDNTKFYVCMHGRLVERSCSNGQVFDKTILRCVNPQPTTLSCCGPLANGGIIPDSFVDTRYYVCENGTLIPRPCPTGQIFNKDMMSCTTAFRTTPSPTTLITTPTTPSTTTSTTPSTTASTTALTTPSTTTSTTALTTPSTTASTTALSTPSTTASTASSITTEPCLSCGPTPDGQIIPDYFNNSRYYICVRGQILHQSCPDGQSFDKSMRICTSTISATTVATKSCGTTLDGGRIPDKKDNTKFYVCDHGEYLHLSCPAGDFFEFTTLRCSSTGTITTVASKTCGQTADGGFAPDLLDNRKFYVCVQGALRQFSCPQGQIFDKYNLRCCGPITTLTPLGCGQTVDGGRQLDKNDNKKYYVCNHGQLQHLSCPAGTLFDPTRLECLGNTSTTTWAPKSCGPTREGEFLPYKYDNTKFYVCIQGSLRLQSCPVDQWFDKETLYCFWKNSTTPQSCGPTPEGGKIPDKNNITKFYVCCKGMLLHETCESGLIFDTCLSLCVPATTPSSNPTTLTTPLTTIPPTTIPPTTIPPTTTTPTTTPEKTTSSTNASTSTTTSTQGCCGPTANGDFLPDETAGNENKFYICINGVLRHQMCQENFIFDKKSKTCIAKANEAPTETPSKLCGNSMANGDIVANPNDNKTYYICIDGQLQKESCPPDFIFDATDLICILPSKTTPITLLLCGSNDHGQFVANDNDNTKFSICYNGNLIPQHCPTGQIFQTERMSCEKGSTASLGQVQENCENGKIIADNNNDSKFFVCINGRFVSQSCVTGQKFDIEKSSCESAASATAVAINNMPCNDLPQGAIIPDQLDKTKFYVCVMNLLRRESCPAGFTFDSSVMYCRKI